MGGDLDGLQDKNLSRCNQGRLEIKSFYSKIMIYIIISVVIQEQSRCQSIPPPSEFTVEAYGQKYIFLMGDVPAELLGYV